MPRVNLKNTAGKKVIMNITPAIKFPNQYFCDYNIRVKWRVFPLHQLEKERTRSFPFFN